MGRGGRYTGGLSVFSFLRFRTWMQINAPDEGAVEEKGDMSYAQCVKDAALLARLEGLEGHARASEARGV